MKENFNLILPTNINEKLPVDPESDHYSFVVYERDAISDATRIVIKSLFEDDEKSKAYSSSPRRIDTLMEFIGVALSLPEGDHQVINKAFQYYRKWLIDPSFFGDMENQNLYIRRIIKQLSIPFGLEIKKETFEIVSEILKSWDVLSLEKGKELDIETWKILLFVIIGVCHHLIIEKDNNKENAEMHTALKQKSVNLCFNIMKRSPFTYDYYNEKIDAKSIWMVFLKYANAWSGDLVFVKVWNEKINDAFRLLYSRLYKYDCGEEHDKFDTVLSDKVVSMMFFYILKAMNYQLTLTTSELLEELFKSVDNIVNQIIDYSSKKSECLKIKFPAKPFFELFGKIITFSPIQDKRYDKAISIRLNTIVKIMTSFDLTGSEDLILKLIATIGWNINDIHLEFVTSFIVNVVSLFETEDEKLPYISSLIVQSIPRIKIASSTSDEILSSIIASFISAMEIDYLSSTYENIFNILWKSTEVIQNKSIRYALICHSALFKIPIFARIIDYFEPSLLKSLINSSNAYLIAGFMGLIATSIRFEFDFLKDPQNTKTVKQIIKSLTEAEIQSSPNFNLVVLSALQMIYTLIEYDSEIFHDEENVGILFKFYLFVQKNVQEKKRKGPSTQRNHRTSSHNLQQSSPLPKKEESPLNTVSMKRPQIPAQLVINEEKNTTKKVTQEPVKGNENTLIINQIHSLLSILFIRLNLHLPSNDYFTHHFNTSKNIDEISVIKTLGITDYVINYYTIGRSLLVSFIESKDGQAVIFSRGPFGKSVWRLTQKYREKGQDPQLSDEILPHKLPEPKPVQNVPITLHGKEVKLIDPISEEELYHIDDNYFKIYSKEYCNWIDWNTYSKYFIPWQYKGEHQRALVNNFLNTIGIFEIGNKLDVRIQSDMNEVKNSIAEFERYENPHLFPIEIIHIMPEDKDLEYNSKHFNRMTPLMLKFLNEIGEAFTISKNDSDIIGWPHLKSPIPVFPCLDGFGAFIVPSLCDDPDTFTKIKNLKAPIRIYFNNTDFQLNENYLKKSIESSNALLVLIVKPRKDGIYFVQQIKSSFSKVSPFSYIQAITAKTLSFYLSLSLELMNYDGYISNAIKDRRNAFNNLCKSSAKPDISLLSPEEFKV